MRVDSLRLMVDGLRLRVDRLKLMDDGNHRFHQLSAIILQLMIMLIIISGLSSCDTVLQYPDGEGMDPNHPEGKAMLHIKAEMEFPYLGEYEYDFENPFNPVSNISRANIDTHQLRYTIRAYDIKERAASPVPKATFRITAPIGEKIDSWLTLELLPGDYRLVVWADYVDSNSYSDKYYNTDDFVEVILKNDDGHPGSSPYRDAFYGETNIHINQPYEDQTEASVILKRPMAKYTFVSNDLREFLDKEASRTRQVASIDQAPMHAPPLTDYTVRIVYTRYMPCSFNVHTGKPADSRTGVEYRSLISMMDEDNAQLAFDHVFTNGSETSVAVAMEVIHKDGTVVGRMPQIDVPLKRSHHTIITGKFLTTKSGGAIGIYPEFDGDFNIFIQ